MIAYEMDSPLFKRQYLRPSSFLRARTVELIVTTSVSHLRLGVRF
jgi:hypothetical protein